MNRPMPSPRGTNVERAFLPPGRVTAAFDAEPDEPMDYSALIGFLADKLEDSDLRQVKRMLGLDDTPEGGASDAALRRYRADARDMHRSGIIGDSELLSRLSAKAVPRQATVAPPRPKFPHANRLKV